MSNLDFNLGIIEGIRKAIPFNISTIENANKFIEDLYDSDKPMPKNIFLSDSGNMPRIIMEFEGEVLKDKDTGSVTLAPRQRLNNEMFYTRRIGIIAKVIFEGEDVYTWNIGNNYKQLLDNCNFLEFAIYS